MGLEMAAARFLLPYYGDSHLIWANLIGVIMAALAGGYFLGGAIADRRPSLGLMSLLVAAAGLWAAGIPVLGRSWLDLVYGAFAADQSGFVLGSLVSVLVPFAVPALLLGLVPPFVIRLSLDRVATAGHLAGRVYAVSTLGSMVGTFAPVLWLMPDFGIRVTFTIIAGLLLLTGLLGLFLSQSATTSRRT